MFTTINTRWGATQRVMAAKLTRLTHKIAIQLRLVAESCTICSARSRRPVRKLLDTPSHSKYCSVLSDSVDTTTTPSNPPPPTYSPAVHLPPSSIQDLRWTHWFTHNNAQRQVKFELLQTTNANLMRALFKRCAHVWTQQHTKRWHELRAAPHVSHTHRTWFRRSDVTYVTMYTMIRNICLCILKIQYATLTSVQSVVTNVGDFLLYPSQLFSVCWE
jgi:hypothetical protein